MPVSATDLSNAVLRQVNVFPELADASYHLVNAKWLNGPFAASYYDFLVFFAVRDYAPERNDCDKFAGWACAVATALHSRTARADHLPPGGLAFGRFHYRPDTGGGHAINWFAYGCPVDENHPEGIAIGFYEPQQRHVVTLSAQELTTCQLCAA